VRQEVANVKGFVEGRGERGQVRKLGRDRGRPQQKERRITQRGGHQLSGIDQLGKLPKIAKKS
jgi:hypothetical protein